MQEYAKIFLEVFERVPVKKTFTFKHVNFCYFLIDLFLSPKRAEDFIMSSIKSSLYVTPSL